MFRFILKVLDEVDARVLCQPTVFFFHMKIRKDFPLWTWFCVIMKQQRAMKKLKIFWKLSGMHLRKSPNNRIITKLIITYAQNLFLSLCMIYLLNNLVLLLRKNKSRKQKKKKKNSIVVVKEHIWKKGKGLLLRHHKERKYIVL